jgi:hypothetical protein
MQRPVDVGESNLSIDYKIESIQIGEPTMDGPVRERLALEIEVVFSQVIAPLCLRDIICEYVFVFQCRMCRRTEDLAHLFPIIKNDFALGHKYWSNTIMNTLYDKGRLSVIDIVSIRCLGCTPEEPILRALEWEEFLNHSKVRTNVLRWALAFP